jgi:hypothetical protein
MTRVGINYFWTVKKGLAIVIDSELRGQRGHSIALSGQAGMRIPLCFISTK